MALVAATSRGLALVSGTRVESVAEADVRSLVADRHAPGRLFAGTQGDGVLRSDDGGRTWQASGLDGRIVKALAISATPDTVYAGTKPPALFRSRDRGQTWDELPGLAAMRRPWWWQPAESPHTPYVSTLAAPPDRAGVLVAGIEAAKLLLSEDGGETWTRLGRGVAADAHELAFDHRDGSQAFLAAGFGASASADAGASWRRIRRGLDRRYCFCLAADSAHSGSAFVAAAPMRSAHTAKARACIYRLDDLTWTKLGGGLPAELDQLPYALATSPLEPGAVYAGLGDGTIWHSPDRGESWTRLEVALPGIRRLTIAATA